MHGDAKRKGLTATEMGGVAPLEKAVAEIVGVPIGQAEKALHGQSPE